MSHLHLFPGAGRNKDSLHANNTTKEQLTVCKNLKYFTSQITSELPGPRLPNTHTSVYALSKLDQRVQEEQRKMALMKSDEKKVVKNQFFYGSHYQQMDQKYIGKPQPAPDSLKSWTKGVQTLEWNRNPENPHTKRARELLYYNSTRPY